MTSIQEQLDELRTISGVSGAAVVTEDGIMVASALNEHFADDVIAGLASFLVSTTRRAMGEAAAFGRFVMHATHGKLLLIDLGESFLVVLTDQFLDIDGLETELNDATRSLRRLATMSG